MYAQKFIDRGKDPSAAPQTVQMVIVWTALLTDHIASGVAVEKNIARYRYYPIYANIAQFPITQYRYRSNPTEILQSTTTLSARVRTIV